MKDHEVSPLEVTNQRVPFPLQGASGMECECSGTTDVDALTETELRSDIVDAPKSTSALGISVAVALPIPTRTTVATEIPVPRRQRTRTRRWGWWRKTAAFTDIDSRRKSEISAVVLHTTGAGNALGIVVAIAGATDTRTTITAKSRMPRQPRTASRTGNTDIDSRTEAELCTDIVRAHQTRLTLSVAVTVTRTHGTWTAVDTKARMPGGQGAARISTTTSATTTAGRDDAHQTTSAKISNKELARFVFTERAERQSCSRELATLPDASGVGASAPDSTTGKVSKHIHTDQTRKSLSAIAKATGHRSAFVPAVGHDRIAQSRSITGRRLEAIGALDDIPTVVLAAQARCRLKVDLFPCALTNVADEQISGLPIKAEAPRIAQSIDPNLVASIGNANEGIVRGRPRRTTGRIDIEAQDGAEERVSILTVALRIAAASSVANADVKHAVGAKGQIAAIVIAERLADRQ